VVFFDYILLIVQNSEHTVGLMSHMVHLLIRKQATLTILYSSRTGYVLE